MGRSNPEDHLNGLIRLDGLIRWDGLIGYRKSTQAFEYYNTEFTDLNIASCQRLIVSD